jgi:putative aldouronate transport system substrate-binding protein
MQTSTSPTSQGNSVKPGLDRRSFLRMAGAASAGLSLLLACGRSAPVEPSGTGSNATAVSAPPTVTTSSAKSSSARLQSPTHIPVQGAKPDLPPTDSGVQAGYLNYPQTLFKSVQQTPGLGGDVTALVVVGLAPGAPLDQNVAAQALNKALNANMKLTLATSPTYPTQVATTMAGGDLPDLFWLRFDLTLGGIPEFLKSKYADLTPYLAGDAIKDYPNLAAFPTQSWKQTVFDGAIYAVPVIRGAFLNTWFYNKSRWDAVGVTPPNNADDFKRIRLALTNPQSNQWGIGELPPAYGLQYTGLGNVPMLAMFGGPNGWAVDANGNFTKDIESEQFKAALGYVRDLFAAGVYYPDPISSNQQRADFFLIGRMAMEGGSWNAYSRVLWGPGLRLNPPVQVRALHPFSHDGGKPIWHDYYGLYGMTAIKQASPERVKELLRILNYLAAPFGSEEYQLIQFGVKGVDFTLDEKGNPMITPQGKTELFVSSEGIQSLSVPMQFIFDPSVPDFAQTAYADQQALSQNMVSNPALGLYSPTDGSKGGPLTQKFSDGLGEIVAGRSPLTALDQLLRDWRSGGGDQMRMEYQQAYAQSKA